MLLLLLHTFESGLLRYDRKVNEETVVDPSCTDLFRARGGKSILAC